MNNEIEEDKDSFNGSSIVSDCRFACLIVDLLAQEGNIKRIPCQQNWQRGSRQGVKQGKKGSSGNKTQK